jgi:hypothetical protein
MNILNENSFLVTSIILIVVTFLIASKFETLHSWRWLLIIALGAGLLILQTSFSSKQSTQIKENYFSHFVQTNHPTLISFHSNF